VREDNISSSNPSTTSSVVLRKEGTDVPYLEKVIIVPPEE
jgi:hypothetical protein